MQRCRRLGWDSRAYLERYDEQVQDVLVNVACALSLRALARLASEPAWIRRAQGIEAALLERCYDVKSGLFFDLAGRRPVRVPISTW